jgi:hypothetical protein
MPSNETTPSSKPLYIERDGGMMFTPPYLQADTFLSGWLVPSQKSAQQALLDRTVNRALGDGPLRYEAVTSRLMLSFADIKRVKSLDAKESNWGYVPERDVTIWFLVAARENGVIKRLVWFLPYIWVDNPLAVVVGREVFGFPKQLAEMKIPSRADDPGPFHVDAPVLSRYSPETRADSQRLIDVNPTQMESLLHAARELGEAGMEELRGLFPESADDGAGRVVEESLFASAGNIIAQLVHDLRKRELPILFLKQIPDAAVAGRACYQRVIEAPARVTSFEKIGLMPGHWSATLHSHDSHRLHESLGVAAGPIELGRGIYLNYSFSMELGQEIG